MQDFRIIIFQVIKYNLTKEGSNDLIAFIDPI